MSKEKNNPQTNEKIDFVKLCREHYADYHNHKENMSHAGLLVQIALVAGLLNLDCWLPNWVPTIIVDKKYVAFGFYLILWAIIFSFTVWQLRNRQKAANYIYKQFKYLVPKSATDEIKSLFSSRKPSCLPFILIVVANILMLLLVFIKSYKSP